MARANEIEDFRFHLFGTDLNQYRKRGGTNSAVSNAVASVTTSDGSATVDRGSTDADGSNASAGGPSASASASKVPEPAQNVSCLDV